MIDEGFVGTIRLACSLAVHYDKQQEQTEDKPHKGKTIECLRICLIELLKKKKIIFSLNSSKGVVSFLNL